MDRSLNSARPLRMTVVLGLAGLLATGGIVVVLMGFSGTAAAAQPTISFSTGGTPPLICGSAPSVSSLTIVHGTKIVLVNNTGADATVTIDDKKGATIADGSGVEARLNKGQHSVRLVPACLLTQSVGVLIVTVEAKKTVVATPSTPPVTEGPAVDGRTGGHGTTSASGGSSRHQSGGGVFLEPGLNPPNPTEPKPETTGTVLAVDGPILDGGLEYSYELPGLTKPRNGQTGVLLAVIALICVLGVTVGIIRTIIAQRTSDAFDSTHS